MKNLPLFLIAILIFVSPAKADWINFSGAENALNIAEIYINDDHIKVNLEIFVNDIAIFHRLVPDDFFEGKDIKRPPLAERLRNFSNEDFQFVTGTGKKLQAQLKLVEPRMRKERPSPFAGMINPYTRQPIPGPPEDRRVLYAELVYPFQSKPGSLTIIPPIDKRGASAVSIGFTAYHKDVPIVSFKYLSNASKMSLDWEDPWHTSFEEKALRRWQQSGVRTFLYIEPYEVRHEVLVRVKDLAQWMDLGLRGDEFIEEDEFDALRQRAGEFFLKRDRVLIDGKSLRPILDRTSFVKYSMTQTRFINVPERMPVTTAMLGVIITYLTDGMPQEVSYKWDLFSDRIQKVPTNAIDPAGPFPSYVTPDDNMHVWKNFLKQYTIPTVEKVELTDRMKGLRIPLISALCIAFALPFIWQIRTRRRDSRPILMQSILIVLLVAGSVVLSPFMKLSFGNTPLIAPKIDNKEAAVILHSLLKNVYRAFDFREEEDVYDKLAISVSGDLLADVYLQNRKSFAVQRAGGAQARVEKVEIQDVSAEKIDDRPMTYAFKSNWTAFGTVGHWGHIHARKNQYEAIVTVEPVEGAWKITGLELLEEKRIDPYAKQQVSGAR
jgi:hypothetical protein